GSTRAELAALHARLSATMIYVTHDQVEAMTLADRIVVLRAGRIEQIGTPLELYNRPANRFVAGFIGSPHMNFLEGTIETSGQRKATATLAGGHRLNLPVDGDAVGTGSRVTLGFRPQH
ncbi:ABC transporter ATP-binding protein, partial [Rhizobiaceae sp. 2RAB30]